MLTNQQQNLANSKIGAIRDATTQEDAKTAFDSYDELVCNWWKVATNPLEKDAFQREVGSYDDRALQTLRSVVERLLLGKELLKLCEDKVAKRNVFKI